MSSFTADPVVTLLKKRRVKVYQPFSFYYEEEGGEYLTIPKDYVSDGASVPRLFGRGSYL